MMKSTLLGVVGKDVAASLPAGLGMYCMSDYVKMLNAVEVMCQDRISFNCRTSLACPEELPLRVAVVKNLLQIELQSFNH